MITDIKTQLTAAECDWPLIKTYRKSRNMTQAQAAELFRVSLRTYKNWELGAHDMPGPAQLALELLIKLKTN